MDASRRLNATVEVTLFLGISDPLIVASVWVALRFAGLNGTMTAGAAGTALMVVRNCTRDGDQGSEDSNCSECLHCLGIRRSSLKKGLDLEEMCLYMLEGLFWY